MTDELGILWEKVLETIKTLLPEPIWDQFFFSGLLPYSIENDTFILIATREYIKNAIDKNPTFKKILRESISSNSNRDLTIQISMMEQLSPELSTILPAGSDAGVESPLSHESQSGYGYQTSKPLVSPAPSVPVTPAVDPTSVPTQVLPSMSTKEPTVHVHTVDTAPYAAHLDISPPSQEDIDRVERMLKNSQYDDPIVVTPHASVTPPTDFYDDPVVLDKPSQTSLFQNQEQKGFLQTQAQVWKSNPEEYTFENFIQGGSNRVAYSVSMKVAEEPGCKYNPLFIYGDPGLGKTHLMYAIAGMAYKNNKDMQILCMTSENFLNAFVNSLRTDTNEEFRNTFRNVDMLLIDDIQFLQDKKYRSTGVEFFNTFNVLYDKKAQIVVTSDTKPEDLVEMEQRMRSRFQQGMVVEIGKPDLETRLSIIYNELEKQRSLDPDVLIPDEIMRYIASTFTENIRMLQGAFKRLIASMSIDNYKQNVTLDYARHVLADLEPAGHTPFITMDIIIDSVVEYYHLKKENLMSKKRTKQYVKPRQIAMYLCRELLTESYPQLARKFDRDHSTIIHAYDTISKELVEGKNKIALKQDLDKLKEKINKNCG